jgi:hypothetical protein
MPEKIVHHLRIELSPAQFLQDHEGLLEGQGGFVATPTGNGVQGVGYRHQAGHGGDRFSLLAPGIATPVPALVVTTDGFNDLLGEAEFCRQDSPVNRVEADPGGLDEGEVGAPTEDAVGNGELAEVVEASGLLGSLRIYFQARSQKTRDLPNSKTVGAGERVAEFQGGPEGFQYLG